MFKAGVACPWEHQVFPTQLLDVAEPLELRSVYDAHQEGVHLNVAVDGVVEDLEREREREREINLH